MTAALAVADERRDAAQLRTVALQSAIFNSANFSSIATDEKGVIQIFNAGAERMLGYAAADVVNKITPAAISDAAEVIARAESLSLELETTIKPGFEALVFKAARGIEDIYELTYIRKDGTRCPAVVSVTALHDAGGAILGYLLIGTDNTARRKAEAALVQAGALQSAIFNSATFSSIATDEKGVIQIFNVGAERMLGYAAVEVVNRLTPVDLHDHQELVARARALSLEFSVEIQPGFEALAFKASRGLEDIYELTKVRKDGSRFPAILSVTALRNAQGTIIGYLLIGTDNTARKQAEAEQEKLDQRLRDQQFYTRSLIESNIDALITTDPRGIITDVNKQTESLTGRSRDELIGAPFKNYFTDAARAEAAIKQVLSEKRITNYELSVLGSEGRETVVSFNATTFHDRDRRLQGVFAAARDVTQQKLIEGSLRRAKTAAETANGELEAFSYSVSHDLRAPLRAIDGFSLALSEDSGDRLDDEGRQNLDRIRAGVQRMGRLIDDLLQLAGVTRSEMRHEQVDLSAAFADIARDLRAAEPDRAVEISIQGGLVAEGDPRLLRIALVNLLGNAWKFTGTTDGARIECGRTDTGSGPAYFVRDNGVGFDMAYVDKLFGAFQRLHAMTEFTGTGIGLATVRRIVARHGGRTWATGAVGTGATLFFTLAQERND